MSLKNTLFVKMETLIFFFIYTLAGISFQIKKDIHVQSA